MFDDALEAELPARELASVPLVLSTAGNSHREQLEDFARRAAIRLNIVAEVDSISGQRELVLNGAASGSSRDQDSAAGPRAVLTLQE